MFWTCFLSSCGAHAVFEFSFLICLFYAIASVRVLLHFLARRVILTGLGLPIYSQGAPDMSPKNVLSCSETFFDRKIAFYMFSCLHRGVQKCYLGPLLGSLLGNFGVKRRPKTMFSVAWTCFFCNIGFDLYFAKK